MTRGWFVSLFLVGCIDANLVECPNGTVCSSDKVCDTIHEICVDPDQVSACDQQPERATCEWDDGAGKCFDGVCLAPGCGNTIIEVELGEACDDGNTQSLDGCSADCASTEICGNGVTDLLEGEACDDANLRSHDGCDSSCQLELPAFTVTGVGVPFGEPNHGAFDEERGRFVHVGDGLTWEFDGQRWAVAATDGVPAADWLAVVYDSHRKRVVLVGGKASIPGIKPIDLYLEWDGTAWLERPTQGLAQAATGIATYDRLGRRVVVYAGSLMWELASSDPQATPVWQQILTPPDVPGRTNCTNSRPTFGGSAIAYDAVRDKVVLVLGGFQPEDKIDTENPQNPAIPQPAVPPVTWELSGGDWECFEAPLAAPFLGAPSLVFDGTAVVAIGGNRFTQVLNGTDTLAFSRDVHRWVDDGNGGFGWAVSTAKLPNASTSLEVGYDTVSSRIYAFGGLGDDDLFALQGTTFAAIPNPDPRARGNALTALDIAQGRLVLLQGDDAAETWVWDDTWTKLSPAESPPLLPGTTMSYDPQLASIVLLDQDTKTYAFDGTTWSQLGGDGLVFPGPMAFDPSRGTSLALAANGINRLDPATMEWVPIGPLPPQNVTSLAFDARNNVVVAMGAIDGRVFTFDGTSWQPTLTPGDASYAVVADHRRGSLDFVSATGTLWERVGDNWTEYPRLPVRVAGRPHYDPKHGRLVMFGSVGRSRVVVTRQLVGAVPGDTCMNDFDADLDGAAGCDDDDCFWRCSPACPPFSSCPE